MTVYNWSEVAREQVNPKFVRRMINGEGITVARIELAKGSIVPEHSHYNEQISMVESGRMRFKVGGEEVLLGPGDVLHIPRNVPHSAEVLEDISVMDLFSPPREDWIRGEDQYLRDQK